MRTSLTDHDTQDLARPPVFVDPTGRRRRILRYVALGACALFVCYLITFIAALLGAPIPHSGLVPLPDGPAQWQDPTQNGAPPAPDGPATGAPERTGPSGGRRPPEAGGPVVSSQPRSAETVTVTPAAGSALIPERPNSNAAPAPPGLTKHSEPKPGRNGR